MAKMTKGRAELESEVNRLNKKYCKNTKNHLKVSGAYGGVKVELTGKEYKRGRKTFYRGIGSGAESVTEGYLTPRETLFNLYKKDSKGSLQYQIKHAEKEYRRRKK